MIKAVVKRTGSVCEFSMTDHAEDRLVCAAASALGLTLANVLKIMEREGQLKSARFTVKSGDMRLTVEPKSEYEEEALHCFYVAAVGLSMLAGKYASDVRFEDRLA